MKNLTSVILIALIVLSGLIVNDLQTLAGRKIDERAQALLRQARTAIGGEDTINSVQNLVLTGKLNKKMPTPEAGLNDVEGNLEMALEMSGKLCKKLEIRVETNGAKTDNQVEKNRKVVVEERQMIVRKKDGGEVEVVKDGSGDVKWKQKTDDLMAQHQANEFSRLVFGLLGKINADNGLNYIGEGNVDGTAAEIIEATGANNYQVKLYLDKSTHLPLMISYRSVKPIVIMMKTGEMPNGDVVIIRKDDKQSPEKIVENGGKVIIRKVEPNGTVTTDEKQIKEMPRITPEEADFQIRFSDFRTVNGLMLPHKWTQTINGQLDETITVTSFEVNVPNLDERRFKPEVREVKIRKND